MYTFGEQLRQSRLKIGLTVDQLAQKAGMLPQAVYTYERSAACPSLTTALKLTKALGESLAIFDACSHPKDRRRKE